VIPFPKKDNGMQWNDRYCTGINEIDEQHKVLFLLTSRLQKAIKFGKGEQEIANTFKELVGYTKYHFASEENEMAQASYGELLIHQKLHSALVKNIRESLLKIREGQKYNPIELLRFLNTWLIDHILEKDMKFARYLKEHQINASVQPMTGVQYLRTNLEKLKVQLNKKLIQVDIYQREKQKLIFLYVNGAHQWSGKTILENFEMIDVFAKEMLITESEKKEFKQLLVDKVDIGGLLDGMPEHDSKSLIQLLEKNGIIEYK
jgi:hemerythrin